MNRMRERRRALGLTMKQLGAIVGVSEGAISHYETGRREPDPDMLKSLASALGVSVDYILGRDQDVAVKPSSDNDVEIRFIASGWEHLPPERRKKMEAFLVSLMDLDDEALDQARQVIDIYHKR